MAVQSLQRIEHVLQEAIVKSQLQPARCLLNVDLLALKQSCSICDQITSSINFSQLQSKLLASILHVPNDAINS